MPHSNNIARLTELVRQSTFFSEEEKEEILKKLPEMDKTKQAKAVTLLEEEQSRLRKFRESGEKNLKLMEEFANQSEKEIEHMARSLSEKLEKRESQTEEKEAEKLLKTIP